MEALSFMKFWLTNTNNKPRREIKISESAIEDPELELCEGEDSFFELEISLSDFSLKKQEKSKPEISKSKVLPFIEPQSPTKSSQKFKAFSLKKSKPIEPENNRSLNAIFRHENDEITSFRKTASIPKSQFRNDTMFDDSVSMTSSKRFFSLIKPLYTKKQSFNSVTTSPASSPLARERQKSNIPSRIRSVKRQLGKSRSASAVVGGMSPLSRVDDSLQVQHDGIQSAILHCKRSFHGSSSRESSLLSRSTSESSSQEKLSTSSSEDSYLFSRMGSDSMSENSIDSLTSISELREKICD